MDDDVVEGGLREMEEMLGSAEVGRLALCDGLIPYVVPVNFFYANGKIAFHCSWEGRKIEIIAKNPNCCFEVDAYMGELDYHYEKRCNLDYDSVLAFGKARIEHVEAKKVSLLQSFAAKYDQIYRTPVSEGGIRFRNLQSTTVGGNTLAKACCVVIDIEEMTGRRERTVEGRMCKTLWRHRFV